MTKEEIQAAVLKWAIANNGASLNGSKIVFANQNAPRPARPFITLFVNTFADGEHSSVGAPDDYGIAEIVSDRMVMVDIQAYGTNAQDIIDNLRLSFEKVRVQEELRRDKIPFIRVSSGFDDTSEVVGSEYEPRAQMDVEFRCAAIIEDDVGLIENVEIEGVFEDGVNDDLTVTIQAGV